MRAHITPGKHTSSSTSRWLVPVSLLCSGLAGLVGLTVAAPAVSAAPAPHIAQLSTVPTLSVFAGNGSTDAVPATPGPARSTGIGDVNFGLAVDRFGDTYISDDQNDYVYKVTPGGTLSIFAGDGHSAAPTPGPATSSSIGQPEGLAVDKAGNLYIADDHENRVYQVTPGGTLSIFAGTGASGAVSTGPATSEPIGQLDGVAFDPSGNLYIVSYGNKQVYKVAPDGTLSVFAGISGSEAAGTPGPAASTSVGFPEGVATDRAGNVYIADDHNNYVYKVTPGGTLSIFAGTGGHGVPTAGPATSSALGTPEYLAVDGYGNVFITDDTNYLLYRVPPGVTR
jgi:sugar lactone lactonase YvrE